MSAAGSDIILAPRRAPPDALRVGPPMAAGLLDPTRVAGVVGRRLPVAIALALLGILLTIVLVSRVVPLYSATATLLIDPRQANIVKQDAVLSGLSTEAAAIESEAELIGSTMIAHRVARRLDLDIADGVEVPDAAGRFVLSGPERDPIGELSLPEISDAELHRLLGGLDVRRRGQTFLITVTYRSSDPEFAARAANAFAEEYLADQIDAKFSAARAASAWLGERVEDYRDRLRKAEEAAEAYRALHGLGRSDGKTVLDQQILKLNEALIAAKAHVALTRANVGQMRKAAKAGGDVEGSARPEALIVVVELRKKLAALEGTHAELRTRYGAKHPAIVNIRSQIAEIEGQIASEARRIVVGAEADYEAAVAREKTIAANVTDAERRLAEIDGAEVGLRELEREAASTRSLLEAFLARFQETDAQQSLQTADSRLIERAVSSPGASEPNRLALFAIGFMLSVLAGIAAAIVTDLMDQSLGRPADVEAALGLPVLATVPSVGDEAGKAASNADRHISMGEKQTAFLGRLAVADVASPYGDAIRRLRASLRLGPRASDARTILVTSVEEGAGRSTLSLSLAKQAAVCGERVLLVDLDFGSRALTRLHAPDAAGGLRELIEGTTTILEAVRIDAETAMRFLPASAAAREDDLRFLRADRRAGAFLSGLSAIFDLVVIDAPSLAVASDIAGLVNGSCGLVLVVDALRSKRPVVRHVLGGAPGVPERIIGVVLNRAKPHDGLHTAPFAAAA